jgi:uncharacterized protein with PQ loop repeat
MGFRERSLTEEMTSKDVSGGHRVVRVHHWALWWFYVGVACAVVAVVNILFRKLTPTQETITLILAVLYWCLGGLVCWALEGIQVEKKASLRKPASPVIMARDKEWHSASEFRLPGTGKALLQFPYKHGTRETLAHYGLRNKGR